MDLAFKPRKLHMKTKQTRQQVPAGGYTAGLHVMSRDFSDEFPCSDIRVIHKISVIHKIIKFHKELIFL